MTIVSKTMGINTNVLFKKNSNANHLTGVAGGGGKKPEDSTYILSGSKDKSSDATQTNVIGKAQNTTSGPDTISIKSGGTATQSHPPAPKTNDLKVAAPKDNGFSIATSKSGEVSGSDMTMKASRGETKTAQDAKVTFKAPPTANDMTQQKVTIQSGTPNGVKAPTAQAADFNLKQDPAAKRPAAPVGTPSVGTAKSVDGKFGGDSKVVGIAKGVADIQNKAPGEEQGTGGPLNSPSPDAKVQSQTVGKLRDNDPNTPPSPAAAQALANTAAALPNNGDAGSSLGGLIGTALIADSDPSIRNLLHSYLSKRQVKTIELCSEGVTADRILSERTFDLVIIDWRLTGVTGLSIYNRLRTRPETRYQKVLVLTGFIAKEDFRILDENPMVSFVEKPLQLTPFTRVLDSLIKEEKELVNIQKMAHQIAQQGKENPSIIEGFIAKIGAASNVPVKVILSVVDVFTKVKLNVFAEKLLYFALKMDPKHPVVLTELAKLLFRSNRATEAMALLKKAQSFSPQSVERLCLLGEVGLTLQQADEAKAYFKKVLEIDRSNVIAKAGLTVSDNMAEHIEANPDSALPQKLASSLNMIGVTLARKKHLKNAVDQYKAALCFLYDDGDQAKLNFNLGMAHLRVGSTDEAVKWLSEADRLSGGTFEKAKIWKEKAIAYAKNKSLPGNTINYQFDDDYES
jgi:CheY-like chemotaxis protein